MARPEVETGSIDGAVRRKTERLRAQNAGVARKRVSELWDGFIAS